MSFLEGNGTPEIVERAMICPPRGQIGPITPEQRAELMKTSLVAGVYENAVDRESAFEILKARAGQPAARLRRNRRDKSSRGTRTCPTSGCPGNRVGDVETP